MFLPVIELTVRITTISITQAKKIAEDNQCENCREEIENAVHNGRIYHVEGFNTYKIYYNHLFHEKEKAKKIMKRENTIYSIDW